MEKAAVSTLASVLLSEPDDTDTNHVIQRGLGIAHNFAYA